MDEKYFMAIRCALVKILRRERVMEGIFLRAGVGVRWAVRKSVGWISA